jgi:hypothetical protein
MIPRDSLLEKNLSVSTKHNISIDNNQNSRAQAEHVIQMMKRKAGKTVGKRLVD